MCDEFCRWAEKEKGDSSMCRVAEVIPYREQVTMWEYMILRRRDEDYPSDGLKRITAEINEYGLDGWELTGVAEESRLHRTPFYRFYFKRAAKKIADSP